MIAVGVPLIVQPLSAYAATDSAGFNLTISPLPISLKTKPGQTTTTPLSVQNTGSQPVQLRVSLMKFSAKNDTGEPVIQDPGPGDTYLKWVSFSKTSFLANPGVLNTVTMTIKVPKDAGFGYYYAVMFSQDTGNQPKATDRNTVNGAVASLVLMEVDAPGLRRELQVTSFTSTKKVYQYLPATFTITVKNTGNTHAVPQGNIFIGRTDDGNFINTLPINEEQGNVLPNSSRTFTVDWGNGFPSYEVKRQNGQIVSEQSGKPVKELKWNLANADKLRFGKYMASMTLVYDNGVQDVPINGTLTFWVIPWIPILIIIAILALLGFGIFAFVRGTYRRAKRLKRPSGKSNKSSSKKEQSGNEA